jgi:hypothetical protein
MQNWRSPFSAVQSPFTSIKTIQISKLTQRNKLWATEDLYRKVLQLITQFTLLVSVILWKVQS